jgi:type III secretory pathway component EscU
LECFEELLNCLLTWVHHFTFPPIMYKVLILHTLANTCYFLYYTHWNECDVLPHCRLICIYLMMAFLMWWLFITCLP